MREGETAVHVLFLLLLPEGMLLPPLCAYRRLLLLGRLASKAVSIPPVPAKTPAAQTAASAMFTQPASLPAVPPMPAKPTGAAGTAGAAEATVPASVETAFPAALAALPTALLSRTAKALPTALLTPLPATLPATLPDTLSALASVPSLLPAAASAPVQQFPLVPGLPAMLLRAVDDVGAADFPAVSAAAMPAALRCAGAADVRVLLLPLQHGRPARPALHEIQ